MPAELFGSRFVWFIVFDLISVLPFSAPAHAPTANRHFSGVLVFFAFRQRRLMSVMFVCLLRS